MFSYQNKKFQGIQHLRAIAAILVVGIHTFWSFGIEGVDIFFVISGFILFYVMEQKQNQNSLTFLADRFFRIAPLYFIFTFLYVLFGFQNIESFHQIIQSITFIKYYQNVPLLPVGWTLEYEFIFYLLCATSIIFFNSQKSRFIYIIFSLSILVILIDFVFFSEKKYGFFAEFILGGLIYLIYQKGIFEKLNIYFSLFLLILGLLIFLYVNNYIYNDGFTYLRFIFYGIPSAFIVAAIISMQKIWPKNKTMYLLGDSSYSIYISHLLTINTIRRLNSKFNLEATLNINIEYFCFFISIFLGVLIHLFFERFISKFIKKLREIKI